MRVSELMSKRLESVNLKDGKEHTITFLGEPRDITTRYGMRTVVNVKEDGKEKSFWINTVGLRRLVGYLINSYDYLENITIKIKLIANSKPYDYEFKVVEQNELKV